MTAKKDFGGGVKKGDTIVVNVPAPHDSPTYITKEMVREALKDQLGRNMMCDHSNSFWDIEHL